MQIRYIALSLGLLLCGNQAGLIPVSAIKSANAIPYNEIEATIAINLAQPRPAEQLPVVVANNSAQTDAKKPEPAVTISKPTLDTVSKATADFRSVPVLRSHLPLNVPEALLLNDFQRKEVECMAWNLYFEVRDGQHNEQVAIAYVPLNRIGKEDFGNNVCTNVFQYNVYRGVRKQQFSWVGRSFGPKWTREDDAWEKMQRLAIDVYLRHIPDTGRGATYFHSTNLMYNWAPRSQKFTLGQHMFWHG